MKKNNLISFVTCVFLMCSAFPCLAFGLEQELPEEPFARGRALLERGKFAEARDQFNVLLQVDPGHLEVAYFRGIALLGLNDPDGAWNDFSRILESDPKNALGHVGRSRVWVQRKNYQEALCYAERAVELGGELAEAHYQKGVVLGWQKKVEAAVNSFKKCLELKADHAYGHYQVGLAYNQLKRKDLAISHLERFLVLAPLAPEAEQVRNLLNFLRR